MSDPAAIGTRYGRRVVVEDLGTDNHRQRRVLVRCDCGDESTAFLRDLRRGCGHRCKRCSARDRRGRPVHKERLDMIRHCTNVGAVRPCPVTDCAMHLDHPEMSCSLDVANEGPHSLEEIAPLLGVTRERVRQIQVAALAKLSHNPQLRELLAAGFEHHYADPAIRDQAMTPRRGAA